MTKMPEWMIRFAAAEGGEKPRVKGLAYSGGKINLGWGMPIVVDLAGMQIPTNVPLLANHDNSTFSRIGLIAPVIRNNELHFDGEIVSQSGTAKGIAEQAKADAPWQTSIGAEVLEAKKIDAGESVTINGQVFSGPLYHLKSTVLREVSVVAIGADSATYMQIAASFKFTGNINELFQNGGTNMDFKAWLKAKGFDSENIPGPIMENLKLMFEGESKTNAPGQNSLPPVAASMTPAASQEPVHLGSPTPDIQAEANKAVDKERSRVVAIGDICGGQFPEIEKQAVSAGWSTERTSTAVLKAMRENMPKAVPGVATAMQKKEREMDARTIEAALCMRSGFSDREIVAEYGENIAELAYKNRSIGLRGIVFLCARAAGHDVGMDMTDQTIAAALHGGGIQASGFSSLSLPGILSNVANKRMLRSFTAQPLIAPKLCYESEVVDFKERPGYRMTEIGDLEIVPADGEIKHFGLAEESASNKAETRAMMISITRQMIYNDDMGVIMKLLDGIGARSARAVDHVYFKLLQSNPKNLFSAGNKNLLSGADSALSVESLQKASRAFMMQKDAGGNPIDIAPRYLLVPPSLKFQAKEILKSTSLIAVGATDKSNVTTYNAMADENLELVVSALLEGKNGSDKAWYLMADPQLIDTFEIVYLQGRRAPTVQTAEADFNKLGIQMRVFFDFGIREQDYRGVLKAIGA